MFGINFFAAQPNPKKAQQKKPQDQVNTQEYLANIGKGIGASELIPPALLYTAGGIGIAATTKVVVDRPDDLDPIKLGALMGATVGSITLASILSAGVVKRANSRYDIMVGLAAEESRTADIFQAIIDSELYKGEKSFMAIVNLLDGVSDADKANLRRRYNEYNEQRLAAAAAQAAQQTANGAGGAPQSQTPPQSPPQQQNTPPTDGGAAK